MTTAGPASDRAPGSPADRVRELAGPSVAPYGMLVDDVEIVAAGSRRIVRIALDRDLADLPDGDHTSPVPPLDLDAVADASRAIDEVLEGQATALFGDRPYLLEVGSAGAERRLILPRHYRANVGRLAELTRTDGTALVARIVAASPKAVTVRPEPEDERGAGKHRGARKGAGAGAELHAAGGDHVLRYADLARARVRVEFGRAWDEPFDPPEDAAGEPDDVPDVARDESGGGGMGPARRGVVSGYGARGRLPRGSGGLGVGGLED